MMMNEQRIKEAFDRQLLPLRFREESRRALFARVTDGKGKRISKSVVIPVLAAVLLLAAVTAVALNHSAILTALFGRQKAPEAALALLRTTANAVQNEYARFSLDEYLFDGESLYIHWSVANPTNRRLLYSFDHFSFDCPALDAALTSELTARDDVALLLNGGAAYGTEERFLLRAGSAPQEKITLKGSLNIWIPLAETAVIDYSAYELDLSMLDGKHLPLDGSGTFFTAYKYENKDLSWYENQGMLCRVATLDFSIALDNLSVAEKPMRTHFENAAYAIDVTYFSYAATGGRCEMRVYPKTADLAAIQAQMDALDAEGKPEAAEELFFESVENNRPALLNGQTGESIVASTGGGMATDADGAWYLDLTYVFAPCAEMLPDSVSIVPRQDDLAGENTVTLSLKGR